MITFIKKNLLSVVLAIALLFVLFKKNTNLNSSFSQSLPVTGGGYATLEADMAAAPSYKAATNYYGRQVAPSDSADRLVITDTSLSLQVKDVSQSIKKIQEEAKNLGGFLVDSHLSKPEMAASGSITVRIPTANLSQALDTFKALSVKVVSESVVGTDVTDQYEDLEARLAVLNKTKAKFESIMDQATRVTDLLEVQRELISLQSQIDSVVGQQKYYQKSADLSKVTVYLSTDDLSLPYAPTGQWRPLVVFKTAVRSLVQHLRQVGSAIIWLAVYSPLILLAFVVYKLIKKRLSSTSK